MGVYKTSGMEEWKNRRKDEKNVYVPPQMLGRGLKGAF